jgi:superfamily II DNA or RNA helicase
MSESAFLPGNLVEARARTWVVQSGSTDSWLRLRPIGGADDEMTELIPELERVPVKAAVFPRPDPNRVGAFSSAELFYDALRFQLRSGAGPFRCFGSLAFEPRSYQFVPLLMALRQKTVRLLIADDVGVGKTIEAGLIVRELMDRGQITSFAVLCPPHLVEQWVDELSNRFNIESAALTASSAAKLEKRVPHGKKLIDVFPVLVVSLDYIKSERHRDYFQTMNFDCLVVDEAHTCAKSGTQSKQLRFELLQRMAADPERHMILLTATPHSGNEDSFYNLLSLLDKEFLGLKGRPVDARDPLRRKLACYFVQRRRKDIAEWKVAADDRETGFPRRMTAEVTYQLSPDELNFFEAVQDYCRPMVSKEGVQTNPLVWYSVLSLFRCVSSSPAAAVQALQNRMQATEADLLQERFSDLDNLDESEGAESDTEPTVYFDDSEQIRDLLKKAQALQGEAVDSKLQKLIHHVKGLLRDGFSPVIFCRFVATAQYVSEALKRAFKDVTVGCVTGALVPGEREALVEETGSAEKRVLVATDCLSEGINLQQWFTAVVHYDLAWNPTRHEQREGRVDRFGQKAREIRCIMIWGENNPVDGYVLNVILKKSAEIRKSLGVIVPIPEEKQDAIQRAIIQASLFKERDKNDWSQAVQPSLLSDEELDELDTVWVDALAKERKNTTVFAQNAIHPEEVYKLWKAQQTALGGHLDVARFCRQACKVLHCDLEPKGDGLYAFPLQTLASDSLKRRFLDEGFVNNQVLDLNEMHRSSDFVNLLSEGVVDEAVDRNGVLIARSAVAASADVSRLTRLYLIRVRYQIRLAYRNQTKRYLMAEEILPIAAEGKKDPKWLSEENASSLFVAKATGNFNADWARRQIAEALDYIDSQKSELESLADSRAQELLDEHTGVKTFTADGSAAEINACRPIDVMGAYVLVPQEE